MLISLVKALFPWGPLFFGVGFVAPLIAQSMDACFVHAPGNLSSVQFGLLLGILLAAVAKLRGRWI